MSTTVFLSTYRIFRKTYDNRKKTRLYLPLDIIFLQCYYDSIGYLYFPFMSTETHENQGEQRSRSEQTAVRNPGLIDRLRDHAREFHQRTGRYNRQAGLATLALIAALSAQSLHGGERHAHAQAEPQSRTEIYLPALFKRIAMEDLPDPTGVPATQQPATPTFEPTPIHTPEPTKNPEIAIELDAETVVSWGRSADPYEIAEPLSRIGFSGGAPVSAVANVEGQTGWIIADVDGKKELAAYRFVYKGPNIVVNDEEIKSGTYFEVTFAELEKRGLVDQLPDADFEYTGPRDEIVKVLARDMEVRTTIEQQTPDYDHVYFARFPKEIVEIPENSTVAADFDISPNNTLSVSIIVRYWKLGSTELPTIALYYIVDDGIYLAPYNGVSSPLIRVKLDNIPQDRFTGRLELLPNGKSVLVSVVDGSGEIVENIVDLPFEIDSPDRAVVYSAADSNGIETAFIHSAAVIVKPDSGRLSPNNPDKENLKRVDKLTTRDSSLSDVYPRVAVPDLGMNVSVIDKTPPDWLHYMEHDATAILIHPGIIRTNNTVSMPEDRNHDFYNPSDLFTDQALEHYLQSRNMRAYRVVDMRVLPDSQTEGSSPVPPGAEREDLIRSLTKLNKSRTQESRLQLAYNGFIDRSGNLASPFRRIANISAFHTTIGEFLPDGISVFTDPPFMPRDYVFDDAFIDNLTTTLATLNSADAVQIDHVVVSAAPTNDLSPETQLEQLSNLVDAMMAIDVTVDFVDVGAGPIGFSDIVALARRSGGRAYIFLADTRKDERLLDGAKPLYNIDEDGNLVKTDEYDALTISSASQSE